jgi:DNA-binding transcriptional LysR family regulator
MPDDGEALVRDRHDCLNLRFPGAKEFQWALQTPEGPRRYEIAGPFESDDGDVLTGWALDGRGIVLKPEFEVAEHLREGRLVPVAVATPPLPTHLSLLSQQRSAKDSKVRLFTDFMVARIKDEIKRA